MSGSAGMEILDRKEIRTAFICYSRKQLRQATAVRDLLHYLGINVFIDHLLVRAGNWRPQLENALLSSDIVILLWSRHASKSSEVARELVLVATKKTPVVPILLDGTELPADLAEWQALTETRAINEVLEFHRRLVSTGADKRRVREEVHRLLVSHGLPVNDDQRLRRAIDVLFGFSIGLLASLLFSLRGAIGTVRQSATIGVPSWLAVGGVISLALALLLRDHQNTEALEDAQIAIRQLEVRVTTCDGLQAACEQSRGELLDSLDSANARSGRLSAWVTRAWTAATSRDRRRIEHQIPFVVGEVAAGGDQGQERSVEASSATLIAPLSVMISPNSRLISAATPSLTWPVDYTRESRGDSVVVLSASSRRTICSVEVGELARDALVFSDDSRSIWVGGQDCTLYKIDSATCEFSKIELESECYSWAWGFDARRDRVAFVGNRGVVRAYLLADQPHLERLANLDYPYDPDGARLEFSRDGKSLVAAIYNYSAADRWFWIPLDPT